MFSLHHMDDCLKQDPVSNNSHLNAKYYLESLSLMNIMGKACSKAKQNGYNAYISEHQLCE